MSPRSLVLAVLLTTGCLVGAGSFGTPAPPAAARARTARAWIHHATSALSQRLPGLGPQMLARVPPNADQVVEVTGAGVDSPVSRVVVYQHTADGWQAGSIWAAHNGLRGWTDHHVEGDLRSPIGVFTLTDAGGLLANPGTRMPYYRSGNFVDDAAGFNGESLAGSFDYLVAIDYNRRTHVSPLDGTRPLGYARGGGIWLHVDRGGPTHGCVSLPRADMIDLLRVLRPSAHPVIVMGNAASLRR